MDNQGSSSESYDRFGQSRRGVRRPLPPPPPPPGVTRNSEKEYYSREESRDRSHARERWGDTGSSNRYASRGNFHRESFRGPYTRPPPPAQRRVEPRSSFNEVGRYSGVDRWKDEAYLQRHGGGRKSYSRPYTAGERRASGTTRSFAIERNIVPVDRQGNRVRGRRSRSPVRESHATQLHQSTALPRGRVLESRADRTGPSAVADRWGAPTGTSAQGQVQDARDLTRGGREGRREALGPSIPRENSQSGRRTNADLDPGEIRPSTSRNCYRSSERDLSDPRRDSGQSRPDRVRPDYNRSERQQQPRRSDDPLRANTQESFGSGNREGEPRGNERGWAHQRYAHRERQAADTRSSELQRAPTANRDFNAENVQRQKGTEFENVQRQHGTEFHRQGHEAARGHQDASFGRKDPEPRSSAPRGVSQRTSDPTVAGEVRGASRSGDTESPSRNPPRKLVEACHLRDEGNSSRNRDPTDAGGGAQSSPPQKRARTSDWQGRTERSMGHQSAYTGSESRGPVGSRSRRGRSHDPSTGQSYRGKGQETVYALDRTPHRQRSRERAGRWENTSADQRTGSSSRPRSPAARATPQPVATLDSRNSRRGKSGRSRSRESFQRRVPAPPPPPLDHERRKTEATRRELPAEPEDSGGRTEPRFRKGRGGSQQPEGKSEYAMPTFTGFAPDVSKMGSKLDEAERMKELARQEAEYYSDQGFYLRLSASAVNVSLTYKKHQLNLLDSKLKALRGAMEV